MTNFPTLASTSLLVNLVVHYWNGTRTDDEIGRKVASRYQTSGIYVKRLLSPGTLLHLRRLPGSNLRGRTGNPRCLGSTRVCALSWRPNTPPTSSGCVR